MQYNEIQCHAMLQYNTVQYKTMQNITIQYGQIQDNAVQDSAIHYYAMQCITLRFDTIQCNALQYNATQCKTAESPNKYFPSIRQSILMTSKYNPRSGAFFSHSFSGRQIVLWIYACETGSKTDSRSQ